jgi:CO/xanthine dehydrogenase FAD-binding subunit
VALVALDAVVHTQGATGERSIPLAELYRIPGDTPDVENVLEHGELITAVEVPLLPVEARSGYLKVRDRASYEFALTSAAVALVLTDGVVQEARVGLGGVGTIPWRARDAEEVLRGAPARPATFKAAGEAALQGAWTVPGTAFKVELGKRTLVRALQAVAGVEP